MLPLILLKMTLLLLVAFVLTLIMQRASAGSRHMVWLVALSALLFLPVLTTWRLLQWRVLPDSFTSSATALVAPFRADRALQLQPLSSAPATPVSTSGRSPAPSTRHNTSASFDLPAWLTDHFVWAMMATWLAVASILAAWLAHGAFSVRRIVRRATPLEHGDWQDALYEIADRLGLAAAPRLVRSADVKMPFACGLVRCTIVLPAESDDWTANRRTAVLIHELGHVRRRDLIGHTLGRLACTLYWFHPMVWTAARHLRAESERACDDLALHLGARPSDYAEHLLDIVTCVRNHATPSVALAMAHRKEFEGRMLAILNPDLRRTGFTHAQTSSLIGVLTLLAVAIGAAAPAPRPAANGPTAPVTESSAPVAESAPPAPTTALERAEHGSTAGSKADLRLEAALGRLHRSTATPLTDADTTARAALLMQMLHGDTAPDVRRIAAWGLNRYDNSPAVSRALAGALANDTDDRVREMAAWALSQSATSELSALSHAALGDRSDEVREVSVWGLGNHGASDPTVLSTLARALGDRSEQVRATAAWALGQFHLATAPKTLLNALTDSDEDVRLKAAWAVGGIDDSAALPVLREALRRETSPEVQRAQLRALIRAGENPEKMVEWLKSADAGVREMAARALAGGDALSPWPWPWPRPIPMP